MGFLRWHQEKPEAASAKTLVLKRLDRFCLDRESAPVNVEADAVSRVDEREE